MRILSSVVLLLLPFSQACATVVRPSNFEFPGELITSPGQTLMYSNVNGTAIAESGVPTVFNYTAEGMFTMTTPSSGDVQVQPLPPGVEQPLTWEQITGEYSDIPAIAQALTQGETDLVVLNQHYFEWTASLRAEYWECMLLFADAVETDWEPGDQEAMSVAAVALDQCVERARNHEFISDAEAAPTLEYLRVYLIGGPLEYTNVGMYPNDRLPSLPESEPITLQQAKNIFFSMRNILRTDPHAFIDLSQGFNAYSVDHP